MLSPLLLDAPEMEELFITLLDSFNFEIGIYVRASGIRTLFMFVYVRANNTSVTLTLQRISQPLKSLRKRQNAVHFCKHDEKFNGHYMYLDDLGRAI